MAQWQTNKQVWCSRTTQTGYNRCTQTVRVQLVDADGQGTTGGRRQSGYDRCTQTVRVQLVDADGQGTTGVRRHTYHSYALSTTVTHKTCHSRPFLPTNATMTQQSGHLCNYYSKLLISHKGNPEQSILPEAHNPRLKTHAIDFTILQVWGPSWSIDTNVPRCLLGPYVYHLFTTNST